MAEFKTQSGLKNYDYNETDNLFSGVWNLNNSNLDKYDPFITGYSFFVCYQVLGENGQQSYNPVLFIFFPFFFT